MDLPSLPRLVISVAVSLAFVAALSSSEAAASKTDVGGAQEIVTQAVSQSPSDMPRTMPATPGDAASITAPLPTRTDNPVACYSTCVIGCNPRQEPPVRPCQKRCANHCWKK